jgi:sugar O-acyltransferase (sialic acid O-acetyltransferase NeuD family)
MTRERVTEVGTGRLSPVLVVGAGGLGREVMELLYAINSQTPTYEVLGFLDDGPVRPELVERLGAAHLGDTQRLAQIPADYVIAIGSASPRRRIDALATALGRRASTLLHPAATIGRDVTLSEGVIVAAGARLTTNIVVGRHSQINLNSTVGHDVVIGDFVTLFGGVHVGGGVVVGDGATLGSGAVILPNVRIGADATVGAGAVVVRDVAPGSTVVGIAARPTLGTASRDPDAFDGKRSDPIAEDAGRPSSSPTSGHGGMRGSSTRVIGGRAMRVELIGSDDHRWTSLLLDVPHDVYHLPGYVALSAGHEGGDAAALLVDDGSARMLLPLIIRQVDARSCDAGSPYGYPGPLVVGGDQAFIDAALAAGCEHLRDAGAVSLFVRLHPLLNDTLPSGRGLVRHGETVVIDLSLPEAELWHQTRSNHRIHINRSIKSGDRVEIDTSWERLEEFKRAYDFTMARLGAGAFYLFDDLYYEELRRVLGDSLRLVTVTVDGELAGGCMITELHGIVQYHLAGTAEGYADKHPSKVAIHFARNWAKARGDRWFHLGGGRGGSDDALLHFKTGFSKLRRDFHTFRAVLNQDRYAELCRERNPTADPADLTDYFPLYRRP